MVLHSVDRSWSGCIGDAKLYSSSDKCNLHDILPPDLYSTNECTQYFCISLCGGNGGNQPLDRNELLLVYLLQSVIEIIILLGEIVSSSGWNASMRDHADIAVQIIAEKVNAFLLQCEVPRSKILGLGCGLPGNVNARTGRSVDNWIHNWHDLSISSPLSEAL